MGSTTAGLVLLLAVAMGLWLHRLHAFLAPPPGYTINDQNCHLVGKGLGMIGSEDLALGRHGILLITSGDLHTVFTEGAAKANPGAIFALDMREGGSQTPVAVEMKNFPLKRRFQPHGVDVSNSTDRLYAISHNEGFSSVDIFEIKYSPECITLPWKCSPVTLNFIHSISSPMFPLGGINDVVEAEPNEVYVTQWQPFPHPANGRNNPANLVEKIKTIAVNPLALLGIKLTTVFHCRWGTKGDDVCKEATSDRFLGANGITISGSGSEVFVNDPANKKISVMTRNKETGSLATTETIDVPVALDNIEYDESTGEILVGTIPDLLSLVKGGEGGDVPIPGGMAVIRRSKEGAWKFESVLEHDGTKLSQISAASRLGQKLVLGSPFSEGLLLCRLP